MSDRPLTYDGAGTSLTCAKRDGFRGYERTVLLGHGASLWEFASTEVLRWGVKTRSGFSVEPGGPSNGAVDAGPVVVGQKYWLVARLGPLRIHEPVQVVAVLDEPDRKGFAYATLAGHPLRGEEAFLVDRRTDGSVYLTIRSITHPAPGPRAAAYPLARLAQPLYRSRYLRSLTPTGT